MGELLASPGFERIASLSLRGQDSLPPIVEAMTPTAYEDWTDDDVAELAASDRLPSLRGIDLG